MKHNILDSIKPFIAMCLLAPLFLVFLVIYWLATRNEESIEDHGIRVLRNRYQRAIERGDIEKAKYYEESLNTFLKARSK